MKSGLRVRVSENRAWYVTSRGIVPRGRAALLTRYPHGNSQLFGEDDRARVPKEKTQ